MYRRILVPLDRSLTAEAVLPYLHELATPGLEEVTLITAVESRSPFGIPAENPDFVHSRTYLSIVAGRLRHEGIPATPLVTFGPVVPTLLRLARVNRADTLLAMATHGEGARASRPYGSVTRSVFRSSPIPVFAVRSLKPAPHREGPIRSLLLPTDGSARSLAAFPHALAFAKAHGARVRLIHVLPRGAGVRRGRPGESVHAETLVRAWMKKLAAPFVSGGVPTRLSVQRGDPAASILASTHSQPVDLIVISTHGETGPTGPGLGSVTGAVLAKSRVPLLIVSAPAAPRLPAGPALDDYRADTRESEAAGLARPARRSVGRRPSWT